MVVTYLGSLVQLYCGEEHCKQISLACVGSARSVWATLGLLLLTACVLSQSTLLRLQVAQQGNCLKLALDYVHFPGLSHSGSGSWVLHKGTDLVGPAICALPRSLSLGMWCVFSPPWSQLLCFLGAQWECCLRGAMYLLWGADLWWMSTIQDPRKTW